MNSSFQNPDGQANFAFTEAPSYRTPILLAPRDRISVYLVLMICSLAKRAENLEAGADVQQCSLVPRAASDGRARAWPAGPKTYCAARARASHAVPSERWHCQSAANGRSPQPRPTVSRAAGPSRCAQPTHLPPHVRPSRSFA